MLKHTRHSTHEILSTAEMKVSVGFGEERERSLYQHNGCKIGYFFDK